MFRTVMQNKFNNLLLGLRLIGNDPEGPVRL